jgi:putative oxidoreductase
MNASVLPLVGRVLIAALFIAAGAGKAMGFAGTAGYFGKLGLPTSEVMTVIAIAVELGGGILLLLGWQTRWVAWGLAIFVVVATFIAHRFWEFDAAQMTNQRTQFLKNFAIVGGLLFLAAFGPGRAAVDRR